MKHSGMYPVTRAFLHAVAITLLLAPLPVAAEVIYDKSSHRESLYESVRHSGHWHSRQWTVMTTRATLELNDEGLTPARIDTLFDNVANEFLRIEAVFSPWRADSELSRINGNASREPVVTTPEVFDLFVTAGEFTRVTEGAFDASFASAGRLYDYRRQIVPDPLMLTAARGAIGWGHVQLDPQRRAVSYTHTGTRVDFGGIAKGYAIDRVVAMLRAEGVRHAYVALGGDSFALGERDGRPWQVGIRHPREEQQGPPVLLPASDLAISTSGDYERYFEVNGERIHHILSPQSGRPVHGVASVTIIADDSITADALSTGVFVLGKQRGLSLINRLKGVSAIIIDEQGNVSYSDDLAPATPAPPRR